MKANIHLLICIALLQIENSFSQTCGFLNGTITLLTQADVNAFPTNYPDCNTLLGNLTIGNNSGSSTPTDISNLSPLSNITQINGNLRVRLNPNLTNLSGLDNLQNVGGLVQISSNGLTSLNGLTGLTSIGSSLGFSQNSQLNNLSALSNLTSIGGYLQLVLNNSLTSLDGLQNIDPQTINSTISGINDIELISNSSLSMCANTAICEALFTYNASRTIVGNATGCNSTAQIQAACLALPVTWSNPLQIHQENESHLLNWSVAQQVNNDYFEIQHSSDGQNFYPIGQVDGEGNYSGEMDYQYLHKSPNTGQNYYRIRQVDYDGRYDYSNIAFIINQKREILIYPNPVNDHISIQSNYSGSIQISNTIGQVIGHFELSEGLNSIDISDYTAGLYYIKDSNNSLLKMVKL